MPDHLVDRFGIELTGEEQPAWRQYRAVARSWPADSRVSASWTGDGELKDHPDRMNLISPGMTMRQAAETAGKKPFDLRHPRFATLDERAADVVGLLMDKAMNGHVTALLEERKSSRRMRRAARLAADERSAEYKEALTELRRAQNLKSPETAYLEVVFKLQQSAEYVRAVLSALQDTEATTPLIADYRKPDLIFSRSNLLPTSSKRRWTI